jgi:hypothetical protein
MIGYMASQPAALLHRRRLTEPMVVDRPFTYIVGR